jgi:hypothetical protein
MADPYKNNVVLYLPMEGSRHGDTVFVEKTGKTVTRNGDVILSTTVAPPFGTTSAYFDGTGDYLSLAGSADFEFASGDFTLEAWVRLAALPGSSSGAVIVSKQTGANRSWTINFWNTGSAYQLNLTTSSSGSATTGSAVATLASLSTSVWYHVAGVRRGNVLMVFLDGVLLATGTETGSLFNSTTLVNVGRTEDAVYYLNGYIKDLRITKGIARYTANFHVAQKPYDWDEPEQPRIML